MIVVGGGGGKLTTIIILSFEDKYLMFAFFLSRSLYLARARIFYFLSH
jgi:hypothetical protein